MDARDPMCAIWSPYFQLGHHGIARRFLDRSLHLLPSPRTPNPAPKPRRGVEGTWRDSKQVLEATRLRAETQNDAEGCRDQA